MRGESLKSVRASEYPRLAIGGVGFVAASSAAVLVFSASRYGFFGDELYFLAAGRRLSFGYADQGFMLPALARLMDTLAPGSLLALRLPVVVLTVLAVVLSAQIARELGGGRAAQILTALAYSTSSFLLLQGKVLSTNAVDTVLWVVITWLVVRWVRTRRDVLLLAAGLVTAVDMQVKWLIPVFWIAVVVGVGVYGPRELLRRPLLWLGGAITVAVTIPTLLWQARNGWPQLGMAEVVSGEQEFVGGRALFVPLALLMAGLLGALLLCYGVWALWTHESLRPYRFLGVVLVLVTVVFLITGGRSYYVVGLYPVVFAAGAVAATGRVARLGVRRRRWARGACVLAVAASVLLVASAVPWQDEAGLEPAASVEEASLGIGLYGEFGWPELTEAVEQAVAGLPPEERATAVIVTEVYWQAGALDQLGRDRLPAVYSPSRGFGYFGTPPPEATTALCVGWDDGRLRQRFSTVEPVGAVDVRLGFPGVTRDVTIWKCAGPLGGWQAQWDDWMHL
ncbi:MAG TPA: glycosyltransferase family 39 protein [Nocardia sp.]|uniref:glycosyltransferase family 39 protein n=1 Tax=Nocardia sp. TaxID=1821 RepID=UPI002B4AE200|nr:glycosyltransferase family 39 protein [Nocardia sp.]HLS77245.1 glycosyltransferase family 39 protein [Nocardia sp.]